MYTFLFANYDFDIITPLRLLLSCGARNTATGNDVVASLPLVLNVLFPPSGVQMRFQTARIVASGEQLVVGCRANSSNPAAKIKWRHYLCGPGHAIAPQPNTSSVGGGSVVSTGPLQKCQMVELDGACEKLATYLISHAFYSNFDGMNFTINRLFYACWTHIGAFKLIVWLNLVERHHQTRIDPRGPTGCVPSSLHIVCNAVPESIHLHPVVNKFRQRSMIYLYVIIPKTWSSCQ